MLKKLWLSIAFFMCLQQLQAADPEKSDFEKWYQENDDFISMVRMRYGVGANLNPLVPENYLRVNASLGDWLQTQMDKKNLKLEYLAKASNVDATVVEKIFTDPGFVPDLELIIKLADVVEVSRVESMMMVAYIYFKKYKQKMQDDGLLTQYWEPLLGSLDPEQNRAEKYRRLAVKQKIVDQTLMGRFNISVTSSSLVSKIDHLGDWILLRRTQKHWTREQLAARVKLNPFAVEKAELHNAPLHPFFLVLLAMEFQVPVDEPFIVKAFLIDVKGAMCRGLFGGGS